MRAIGCSARNSESGNHVNQQDLKRQVVLLMQGAFRLFPDRAVRAAIRLVPRLAAGAPPGIEVQLKSFLGEFNVALNTTSCVERSMIRGTYEPGNVRVIRDHVRPGDLCVDVGANVGAMTLAMAQAAAPGGQVFAFEPGPPFFDRLTRNVELNPAYAATIRCENVGVSDTAGTLRWAEDPRDFGRGNGGVVASGGVEIPVVTLDSYVAEHVRQRVAFIKVDVEGWELHVLRGARGILRKDRPVVLFEALNEFNAPSNGELFTGLATLFRESDYDLFGVTAGGRTFATEQLGVTQMMLARPKA